MKQPTVCLPGEKVVSLASKLSLILFLLLAGLVSAQAQNYREIIQNSEGRDFKEVEKEVERMYDGKFKGKGSGYKQLQRWLYFHRSRLTSGGRIQNVSSLLEQESQSYAKATGKNNQRIGTYPSGANWTTIGATSYENKAGYNGGVGRINIITADPSNANILYAGTPAAGLWRSSDGGTTWQALTNDLPGLVGISGIVIDPSSSATNRTIYR